MSLPPWLLSLLFTIKVQREVQRIAVGPRLSARSLDKPLHLMPLSLSFHNCKVGDQSPQALCWGSGAGGTERIRDKTHVSCLGASEIGVITHFGPHLGYWIVGLP